MSDKKPASSKQEAEYTLRHETVARYLHKKRLANAANDTEGKPLPLDVSGVPARASDPYLHSHIVLVNIPVIANETRRKGGIS